ncbi:unnamed protein product [Rhizophagus irregularis]|nr:unnamed protein product [Rhizophagus irregularis]
MSYKNILTCLVTIPYQSPRMCNFSKETAFIKLIRKKRREEYSYGPIWLTLLINKSDKSNCQRLRTLAKLDFSMSKPVGNWFGIGFFWKEFIFLEMVFLDVLKLG